MIIKNPTDVGVYLTGKGSKNLEYDADLDGVIELAFKSLTDVPSSYSGLANKRLIVNSSEDAIEADFINAELVATSDLLANESREDSSTSTTYAMVKEVTLSIGDGVDADGTLQISFDVKGVYGASHGVVKIYKNGVDTGYYGIADSDTTYKTFVIDVSGWNDGDKVQLWLRTTNTSVTAYTKHFSIFGGLQAKKPAFNLSGTVTA